MKLIAKKAMRYSTRSMRAGEEFEASAKDGKLLVLIGKATIAGADEVVSDEDPIAVEKPARKRKSQD
jgi:hypothetical protein